MLPRTFYRISLNLTLNDVEEKVGFFDTVVLFTLLGCIQWNNISVLTENKALEVVITRKTLNLKRARPQVLRVSVVFAQAYSF